jgi:monoterpene epsilon-lactone hydrolase
MPPDVLDKPTKEVSWLEIHPLRDEDSIAVANLRSIIAPMKGKAEGIAGREPFNDIMERVVSADGVTFQAARVGGISGWWAKPPRPEERAAILHVHGGWFNWGNAKAFRNFAGHIASNAGVNAFIPDYRLAPEHPFPAAVRDLEACYRGLIDEGITRIALTGDSAGGNLALVLLSLASAAGSKNSVAPVGAVVFSPITDVALTGASYDTRSEADLFFTKSQAAGLIRSYLGTTDPKNSLASPLFGDLSGLPPVRVHVGDAEVLLDDSRRYVERAVAAGVDTKLDLWMGMPHGFVTNTRGFNAAAQALKATGAFLSEVISVGHLSKGSAVVKTVDGPKETNMAPKPKIGDGIETVEPAAEARSQDALPDLSLEEIRRRAYEIYLGRGEEPGHEIEDWLQAERELIGDQLKIDDK